MKNIAVYTGDEFIGDGIIKLRFIDALKRAFPESRLTWIVGGETIYETALKSMVVGKIDEVLHVPPALPKWRDVFGAQPDYLQDRHFDVVIDTQKKIKRMAWLKRHVKHDRFLSARVHGRLAKLRQPELLFDQMMILADLAAKDNLAVKPVELDSDIWINQVRSLLPHGPRYMGFVPGAGQDVKRWSIERYLELANIMTARGYDPVFILGPRETELEERIRQAVPHAYIPHRATGMDTTDPRFTMALGQVLSFAVANDSGGGHLVAVGDVPMVSLARSGTVRRKFLPATTHCLGLSPDMFGGENMDDIPLSAVIDALDRLGA